MPHRLKDRVGLIAVPSLASTRRRAGQRTARSHRPSRGENTINAWADSLRQLQPEDVAHAIVFCVSQPAHVNINEILMRPTDQER